MSSNKNIAQLSNRNDISQQDKVTVNDVAGVFSLIKKGNVLIKFYSADCHHCIEMAKEWDDLIKNHVSNKNQPAIISIESEFLGNKDIHALLTALKIHISGFPTIVFVKHDKSVIVYEGKRTAKTINEFISIHSMSKNSKHSMSKNSKHSKGNKQNGGISKKYVGKRQNKRN